MNFRVEHNKMILSGLLILGLICTAYSKPATDNQDNDYPMQSDDDYQYDDENVSPHSKPPVDVLKPTLPPQVILAEYTKHVQSGEDAVLECPVSNLSATNVIMWRNGSIVLSQDKRITNNRVTVDNNFTLTIYKVDEMDSRTYTCQIHPQKLEVNAKLIVSNEPQNETQEVTTTTPSNAYRGSFTALTFLLPTVLTCLLNTNSVQRI